MSTSLWKRALWINGVILGAALLYAIAFTLARRAGLGIFDCAFLKTFGLNCPGCGGSRALLSLWRLNLSAALYYSPGLVYSVLVLLWYDLTVALSLVRRDDTLMRLCPRALLLAVPFVFLAVFLVRLYRTLCLALPPI